MNYFASSGIVFSVRDAGRRTLDADVTKSLGVHGVLRP